MLILRDLSSIGDEFCMKEGFVRGKEFYEMCSMITQILASQFTELAE